MLSSSAQIKTASYGWPARSLHWAGAILIVATAWAGYSLGDLSAFQKLRQLPWHKSLGFAVFALTLLRLAWRAAHTPPAFPGTMKKWEVRLAFMTHTLLYFLMVAAPLTGWLMSSALGLQTVPFGIFALPDLLPRDRELGEVLKQVHFVFNKSLIAVAVFHVLAAIKHALDRDGVVERMLPSLAKRA